MAAANEIPDHLREKLKCTSGTEYDEVWNAYQKKIQAHQKYLDNSVEIHPIPAFCFEVLMFSQQNSCWEKVFVNICKHFRIPEPRVEPIPKEQQQNGMTERYRIPCSCTAQHTFQPEEKENLIYFYDVVFHPDVINECMKFEEQKQFLINIALANIKQKENIEINDKTIQISIEKNYMGYEKPIPQRVKKAKNLIQESDKPSNLPQENMMLEEQKEEKKIENSFFQKQISKRKIQPIINVLLEDGKEEKWHPDLKNQVTHFRLKAYLPLCDNIVGLDIDVDGNIFQLKEEIHGYQCSIKLPLPCSEDIQAKFLKKSRVLKVTVKVETKIYEEWKKKLGFNEKLLLKLV